MSPLTLPRRQKNDVYRSREHLTKGEVYRLIESAGSRGRHKVRDRTLLLLMFRHGLRAGEAVILRWDAVLWDEEELIIHRLKRGVPGWHQLQPNELEALKELKGEQYSGNYLFCSERGEHLTPKAVSRIVENAGKLANLPLPVHPHMLRHACGFYLGDQGQPTKDIQGWLGHKSISNTVKYVADNPARYERFRW